MIGARFCACTEAMLANAALAMWPDAHLPWAILDLVPGIDEEQLKAAVEWAFSFEHGIQAVCGIQPVYEETARNARLLITARRIDGPMGILAECELPMPGMKQVRMWLDLSERWVDEPRTQQDIILPIVIRHEGCHGIGTGHAPEGSWNWMAPAYDPRVITAAPGTMPSFAAAMARRRATARYRFRSRTRSRHQRRHQRRHPRRLNPEVPCLAILARC
jgi:hypothetical protein